MGLCDVNILGFSVLLGSRDTFLGEFVNFALTASI